MANLVSTRNAVAVGNGFIFADGGRADAGYKGKTGDCVVRAVAIATGIDYKTAYNLPALKVAGGAFTGPAMRLTSSGTVGIGIARQNLLAAKPMPPTLPKPKVTTASSLPASLAAVRDGVVYDTYDSSHKMVYGYFANLTINPLPAGRLCF